MSDEITKQSTAPEIITAENGVTAPVSDDALQPPIIENNEPLIVTEPTALHSEPDVAANSIIAINTVTSAPALETKSASHKKLVWVIVGGIVMLNVAMLGATVMLKHSTKVALVVPSPVVNNSLASASSSANQTKATTATEAQPTTLHYVSTALNLEFDYPIDWRISSSTDSSDIQLSSGKISFTDYTGAKAAGIINVTITAKPTDSKDTSFSTQFLDGSEVIAANSTNVNYLNPTAIQRKATNLTYVQDNNFNNPINKKSDPNAVDLLLVTGNVAYKKGQTLASQSIKAIDPQTSAYIDGCPEISCMYRASAAVTQSTWDTDPNLSKFKTLVASVRITK